MCDWLCVTDDTWWCVILKEVDDRYDQYQMCNVCVDGKDPLAVFGMSDRTCKAEPYPEYICDCDRGKVCDDHRVGMEYVDLFFAHLKPRRRAGASVDWWRYNAAQKLGGKWYSTPGMRHTLPSHSCFLSSRFIFSRAVPVGKSMSVDLNRNNLTAQAMCTDHSKFCSWRMVATDKRVSKQCADESMLSFIERQNPLAFAKCKKSKGSGDENVNDVLGDLSGDLGKRDTNDPCWIHAFFDTTLGNDADKGDLGEKQDRDQQGMSIADLELAWTRPFTSTDPKKGGCPALDKHAGSGS